MLLLFALEMFMFVLVPNCKKNTSCGNYYNAEFRIKFLNIHVIFFNDSFWNINLYLHLQLC